MLLFKWRLHDLTHTYVCSINNTWQYKCISALQLKRKCVLSHMQRNVLYIGRKTFILPVKSYFIIYISLQCILNNSTTQLSQLAKTAVCFTFSKRRLKKRHPKKTCLILCRAGAKKVAFMKIFPSTLSLLVNTRLPSPHFLHLWLQYCISKCKEYAVSFISPRLLECKAASKKQMMCWKLL